MMNFEKTHRKLQRLLDLLVMWLIDALEQTAYQLRLLPHRPRMLWHKLWIRKDEFHHSLDLDVSAMMRMNKADQQKYLTDLMYRRNVAHEIDLDT